MAKQKKDKLEFDSKDHWEHVYSAKKSSQVSWYQKHPRRSLDLIKAASNDLSARIIDVGGGASTLVDCLLNAGYQNLTVLDISQLAIQQAKSRVQHSADRRAARVAWLVQDINELSPDRSFDIWHDRAVFHFLTDADERSNYVRIMSGVLKPGAQAIIASFNLDGPEKCSGLDVVRYSTETMSAVVGNAFQLLETSIEEHVTPRGSLQNFVYCRFERL
jgi:ubiquinone/menaquinone biosynthesis C-methylase UbiE